MVYQAEEIERLKAEKKELEAEIKAAEIELETTGKQLADARQENEALRDRFEKYMADNMEKVKALGDAEKAYGEAMDEMKKMKAAYKNEMDKLMAAMRRENNKLN